MMENKCLVIEGVNSLYRTINNKTVRVGWAATTKEDYLIFEELTCGPYFSLVIRLQGQLSI